MSVSSRQQSIYQATLCLLVIFVLYVILNLFPFERAMAPRENRPRMANIREETMRKDHPLISKARREISLEMDGFDFGRDINGTRKRRLDDLVMERGGTPTKAVIFTSWRSGSTFLGDILLSHPGTFYHYEPLLHFGIRQVRPGNDSDSNATASEAARVLKRLLSCDYSDLGGYISYGRRHHELFSHNRRFWKRCGNGRNRVCWKPTFLSSFCRLFPFQSMKTVRVRVELARSLLEDPDLWDGLKVLLLVRDPRGTMQSRTHRKWCPGKKDCDDPAVHCQDLVNDFRSAQLMQREYKSRFKVVRYEDMAKDPTSSSREILNFFGFDGTHPSVEKFLLTHTHSDRGGVSSTFRDSSQAPYHWQQDLPWESIREIQGYKMFS